MDNHQHHLQTLNSSFSIPNSADYQISGTSESLSLLSEPPDIRNWFSSYEYESPELGLQEDEVGGYEKSKESIVAKLSSDGFVNPKINTGDYSEKAKHESEILDSDSFSLSSEPPDITRWFSSYVYESPTLDSNLDSQDSAFSEGKHNKGFGQANTHTFDMEKHTYLNDSVKNNSSLGDKKYDKQFNKEDFIGITGNEIPSVLYGTPSQMMMSEHVSEEKETDYHDTGSTKEAKGPRVECEDRARTEKEPKEDSNLSNSSYCSSRNLKSPKRLALRSNSTSTPSFQGSDKENKGKIATESGFISTGNRSARTNEGFSLKRPMEDQSDRLKNSVKERSVVYKKPAIRTPLSETTNYSAVSAPEITGKWKCPQKTKPKLGPPLKQLRLEQWINRVT